MSSDASKGKAALPREEHKSSRLICAVQEARWTSQDRQCCIAEQILLELKYLKATIADLKIKKRITDPQTKKYKFIQLPVSELKTGIKSVQTTKWTLWRFYWTKCSMSNLSLHKILTASGM